MVSRSQTNAARLEELEEQLLITDDASREHCLREGRQLAINTCLERFQANMEMLFLSIKRKQVSVKNSASAYVYIHVNYSLLYVNFTASSKQRAHLRHSVATEKKRLETCIDKYNQLCSVAGDEHHITSVESILEGDFPWSLLTGDVSFKQFIA